MRRVRVLFVLFAIMCVASVKAQTVETLKYGTFEQWITRKVKESRILGGNTKTLLEIGPTQEWEQNKPYVNAGGSPWATSNVMAKVCGVVKTNTSVYRDSHAGGSCVKLVTHLESAKALGIVNITVLAAGSLYTGQMVEPITSSSNPMSKLSIGIPFTKRPKALRFDYKILLTDDANRIRETGFSKTKTISGKDYPDAVCILQKRWEDSDGNIHAKRIATMVNLFKQSCDWQTGTFTLDYGQSNKAGYGLRLGDDSFYALNSKGKNVRIIEEWGSADEVPTHLVIKFDSSYGGAYVGSVGTTMWVDNVKLVY